MKVIIGVFIAVFVATVALVLVYLSQSSYYPPLPVVQTFVHPADALGEQSTIDAVDVATQTDISVEVLQKQEASHNINFSITNNTQADIFFTYTFEVFQDGAWTKAKTAICGCDPENSCVMPPVSYYQKILGAAEQGNYVVGLTSEWCSDTTKESYDFVGGKFRIVLEQQDAEGSTNNIKTLVKYVEL